MFPFKTYTMDCYFRQEWKDDRLAFDEPFTQISLSMKMLELIWKPDTYFLNGKESYLHKIPTSNRLVRLSKDGSILYSSRLDFFTINLYSKFELNR